MAAGKGALLEGKPQITAKNRNIFQKSAVHLVVGDASLIIFIISRHF